MISLQDQLHHDFSLGELFPTTASMSRYYSSECLVKILMMCVGREAAPARKFIIKRMEDINLQKMPVLKAFLFPKNKNRALHKH